jgi:hypothetical protein
MHVNRIFLCEVPSMYCWSFIDVLFNFFDDWPKFWVQTRAHKRQALRAAWAIQCDGRAFLSREQSVLMIADWLRVLHYVWMLIARTQAVYGAPLIGHSQWGLCTSSDDFVLWCVCLWHQRVQVFVPGRSFVCFHCVYLRVQISRLRASN